MKLPFRPPKKKKLQATTARRMREADFTEEPNVKLLSAFIVVLVLHIVAVGGIYAFTAIKEHQPPAFEEGDTPQPQQAAQTAATAPAAENAGNEEKPAVPPMPAKFYRVKSGDTIARIASSYGVTAEQIIDLNNVRQSGGIHVGQELQLPPGASIAADDQPSIPKPAALRDSGTYYTVVRGDTPVSIARKLHVGYDDLLRLNKIEDPKKLRIGIKLKVPVRHPAATVAQAG